MRVLTSFPLVLALCGPALGAPAQENDLEIKSVDVCKPVTVIINILSQIQAPATSFCSSFISIPLKTVTSATVSDLFPRGRNKIRTQLMCADRNVNAKTCYSNIHNYDHAKSVGPAFLNFQSS